MSRCSLSDVLGDLLQRHHVPGAQVAILIDGRLCSTSRGVAEVGGSQAVTSQTVFPLGSLTKVLTAVAMMQAVALDGLDLDRPIASCPGLRTEPRSSWIASVTARHLLSHSSGLPLDVSVDHAPGPWRPRDLVAACARSSSVCAVGEAFSYSNVGYALLGDILQTTLDEDWHYLVTSRILRPLGISSAGVPGASAFLRPAGSAAVGHFRSPASGRTQPAASSCPPHLIAAGGAYGSAEDLARLGRVFTSGGPGLPGFGGGDAADLCRPIPHLEPLGLADGWGLGVARYRTGGRDWHGHDGSAPGATAHLRFDMDTGTVVACTTNAMWGAGLWRDLIGALADEGIAVGDHQPLTSDERTKVDLAELTGRYRNGETTFDLVLDGGGNRPGLRIGGGPTASLEQVRQHSFVVSGGPMAPRRSGGFLYTGSRSQASHLVIEGIRAARDSHHDTDDRVMAGSTNS